MPVYQCVHDAVQMRQLLQMGADINTRDKKGLGLLHFAAAHGKLEIVKFLWSMGAEIDPEEPGVPCTLLAQHHTLIALQHGRHAGVFDGNNVDAARLPPAAVLVQGRFVRACQQHRLA